MVSLIILEGVRAQLEITFSPKVQEIGEIVWKNNHIRNK